MPAIAEISQGSKTYGGEDLILQRNDDGLRNPRVQSSCRCPLLELWAASLCET